MINTRKDLTNYLQLRIDKSSKEFSETENNLKTYIVESNNGLKIFSDKFKMKLIDTQDTTLKILEVIDKKESKKITFFVDNFDKRFLIFYSLDESKITDRFISSLIEDGSNKFDYPWFFNEFMNKIGELGNNECFSIKFQNEFIKEEQEEEIEKFSMRFWGTKGKRIIEQLDKQTDLSKGLFLSNIGLKIGDSDSFIKENMSHQGRFTVIKGNSIIEHFHIVNTVRTNYRRIIEKIEQSSIRYKKEDGRIKIEGEPLILEFNKEINDINYFVNILTSCKNPFRLWGVYNPISENYISINGIDLHTGDKIDLEITNKWIRIYLPEGSCGNVVMRLFTNIQKYFDSKAKLYLGDEKIE